MNDHPETLSQKLALPLVAGCLVAVSMAVWAQPSPALPSSDTVSIEQPGHQRGKLPEPRQPRPGARASNDNLHICPPIDPVAAPSEKELNLSIRRGVDFLMRDVNPDNSWGSHRSSTYRSIYTPVPGCPLAYRAGTTGLCVMALLAADPSNPDVVDQATRSTVWLLDNLPKLGRGSVDTIYNIWGHAYGLRAICALSRNLSPNHPLQEKLREVAATQVAKLDATADIAGGWGYLDFDQATYRPSGSPTSFATGSVLLALKDAEDTFSMKPSPRTLRQALAMVLRQRTPAGTYVYSEPHTQRPVSPINRVYGSLGRMPVCNLALFRYQDPREGNPVITRDVMRNSLNWLWHKGEWVRVSLKKPIPHESFAQNAGYFYYYGCYYAGETLPELDRNERAIHAAHLCQAIMPLQSKTNGDWWDFPLYAYAKPYSTAYAVMALSRARQYIYPEPCR